jgi:hypothetical protein
MGTHQILIAYHEENLKIYIFVPQYFTLGNTIGAKKLPK